MKLSPEIAMIVPAAESGPRSQPKATAMLKRESTPPARISRNAATPRRNLNVTSASLPGSYPNRRRGHIVVPKCGLLLINALTGQVARSNLSGVKGELWYIFFDGARATWQFRVSHNQRSGSANADGFDGLIQIE